MMASVAAPARPQPWLLLAGALALLLLLASPAALTPAARAQDEAPKTEGEGAAAATTTTGSKPNIFMHMLESVGWFFGITLLIVSIALVTLVVLLIMELRMSAAIPPAFVEDFTDTVNKRRFKEAYEMAKEDPSFVARVLTAGMSRLQYGIEDAREASFSMLESVRAGKEQLIIYLATIGTLGPLLGLVGTVFGMILSFMTLSAGNEINTKALSSDISHALVITLLGIGLSVPAICAHAVFKNRLTRITHDAGTVADDLLTQMYYNSKKAAAEAPPPPTADARPIPPPAPAVKPAK
jgi:biopolymer transport protein ExbB